MTAPALAIAGLTKRYGAVQALMGIDLRVGEGEFVGLLGPNGAGKTTTINILSGLCNATAGVVRLFGHDLARDARTCRRLVGLVPQEFNFDQFVRLRRMLLFTGGFFGLSVRDRATRADELLAQFDLTAKADASIRQLSGGMKRRALIARALVHRPRLLILDEPTAGVDVDLRRTLWRALRDLRAAGTTILLTTHYIEEAESLCDRIAIIRAGRIIADESTRGLVAQLTRESTVVSLVAPLDPARLEPFADLEPRLNAARDELTVTYDTREASCEAVLGRLVAARLGIQHVHPADNRLEQVFLQLTREGAA